MFPPSWGGTQATPPTTGLISNNGWTESHMTHQKNARYSEAFFKNRKGSVWEVPGGSLGPPDGLQRLEAHMHLQRAPKRLQDEKDPKMAPRRPQESPKRAPDDELGLSFWGRPKVTPRFAPFVPSWGPIGALLELKVTRFVPHV